MVVVTGARQTGKSTLVQFFDGARERSFVTLDSIATLDRAHREPEEFVASAKMLTIDEVQRAPELLLSVKKLVDERRKNGQFLLTGSANLLLLRRVSETLAGRAAHLVLRPMTEREKCGSEEPALWGKLLAARDGDAAIEALPEPRAGFDWRRAAIEGGLPPAALAHDPADRQVWLQGYVDTYLHRDLRDFAHVGDLAAFARLMRLVALRAGGLLNSADLARDAGLPRTTVQRWLSILEASFLVTPLQPFARSRAKRLIKSPKIYPGDTGVFLHLAGVAEPEEIENLQSSGAWLESLVLNDLLAWRETEILRSNVSYRRSVHGEEIDFVLEQKRRLLPIEIKSARSVRTKDAAALDAFCEEFGTNAPFGLLLYDGRESLRLTRHTIAVPLASVL